MTEYEKPRTISALEARIAEMQAENGGPDGILFAGIVPPNYQMMSLRDMLDAERIAWEDRSDELFCRTRQLDEDGGIVFSAVCGRYAYGEIELWTASMIAEKADPVGLATAEEALKLIRAEVAE